MDRIRWINKGKTQRLLGRIIKPNEQFYAFADEIPAALRNTAIVPVDPVQPAAQPRPIPTVAVPTPAPAVADLIEEDKAISLPDPRPISMESVLAGYSITERSPGWFDVIDPTGKVVNEQPQTEEEAKQLIEDLR